MLFLFFSFGLHVESSPVYTHSSKYTLCKESPVGIHNACSHAMWCFSLHLGSTRARVAPLPTRFRQWKPFWIRSGSRSKRPSWKSGSSSAVNHLPNKILWISCVPTALTTLIAYVTIILQHPDHRNNFTLFLGHPRGLKIRLIFGIELRHHFLLYGDGLNATSFIPDNFVPFLNAWICLSPMKKYCAGTMISSLQNPIISLRGSS